MILTIIDDLLHSSEKNESLTRTFKSIYAEIRNNDRLLIPPSRDEYEATMADQSYWDGLIKDYKANWRNYAYSFEPKMKNINGNDIKAFLNKICDKVKKFPEVSTRFYDDTYNAYIDFIRELSDQSFFMLKYQNNKRLELQSGKGEVVDESSATLQTMKLSTSFYFENFEQERNDSSSSPDGIQIDFGLIACSYQFNVKSISEMILRGVTGQIFETTKKNKQNRHLKNLDPNKLKDLQEKTRKDINDKVEDLLRKTRGEKVKPTDRYTPQTYLPFKTVRNPVSKRKLLSFDVETVEPNPAPTKVAKKNVQQPNPAATKVAKKKDNAPAFDIKYWNGLITAYVEDCNKELAKKNFKNLYSKESDYHCKNKDIQDIAPGNGLFSKAKINKNSLIAYYSGQYISPTQYDIKVKKDKKVGDYAHQIVELDLVYDCYENRKNCMASFANCPDNLIISSKRGLGFEQARQNAEIRRTTFKLRNDKTKREDEVIIPVMYALEDIDANKEIFVRYSYDLLWFGDDDNQQEDDDDFDEEVERDSDDGDEEVEEKDEVHVETETAKMVVVHDGGNGDQRFVKLFENPDDSDESGLRSATCGTVFERIYQCNPDYFLKQFPDGIDSQPCLDLLEAIYSSYELTWFNSLFQDLVLVDPHNGGALALFMTLLQLYSQSTDDYDFVFKVNSHFGTEINYDPNDDTYEMDFDPEKRSEDILLRSIDFACMAFMRYEEPRLAYYRKMGEIFPTTKGDMRLRMAMSELTEELLKGKAVRTIVESSMNLVKFEQAFSNLAISSTPPSDDYRCDVNEEVRIYRMIVIAKP